MSPKRYHFLILLLILIVIAGLFYFFKTPKTIAPENSGEIATSTTGEVLFTYSTKTISEENKEKNYSIKAIYPVFSLKDADAQKNLNDNVALLVQDEVSANKISFEELTDANKSEGPSTFTMTFITNPNKTLKNVVPVKFSESFYSAGAAHPGESVITANYDLKDGEPISLVSLFRPGSRYLEVLSSYSIDALEAKLGPNAPADQIESGAGPKESNFQNFLITDDGLVIVFNEYQVAAYAAGEQEVTVPWNELKTILNPSGPLRSKINS